MNLTPTVRFILSFLLLLRSRHRGTRKPRKFTRLATSGATFGKSFWIALYHLICGPFHFQNNMFLRNKPGRLVV